MNEVEQMFFKTFNIEVENKGYCMSGYCQRQPSIKFADCDICRNCKNGRFYTTPEITPYRLIEIICAVINIYGSFAIRSNKPIGVKDLKDEILIGAKNRYILLSKKWKSTLYSEIRKIMEVEK